MGTTVGRPRNEIFPPGLSTASENGADFSGEMTLGLRPRGYVAEVPAGHPCGGGAASQLAAGMAWSQRGLVLPARMDQALLRQDLG